MEHFLYLLIMYPFGKDPTESTFKGKKNGKWLDKTSVDCIHSKRTSRIVYCQLNQVLSAHEVILDANHRLHGELHFLEKLLPKEVRSRAKTFFPQSKAFTALLCSSFRVKMPSSSHKSAATAVSMLISVAPARLPVASSA